MIMIYSETCGCGEVGDWVVRLATTHHCQHPTSNLVKHINHILMCLMLSIPYADVNRFLLNVKCAKLCSRKKYMFNNNEEWTCIYNLRLWCTLLGPPQRSWCCYNGQVATLTYTSVAHTTIFLAMTNWTCSIIIDNSQKLNINPDGK